MHSLLLIVLLWALVGIPAFVRFLQERKDVPMDEFQRAMGALGGTRAGAVGPAAAVRPDARRRLVSTLTYTPGAALAMVGAASERPGMLTAAVALLNLGTVHRLLAMSVDRSNRRASPVPARPGFDFGPARLEPPFDPGVDQRSSDAQTGGDSWQIIWPEPRGVDDLVLVDTDVS